MYENATSNLGWVEEARELLNKMRLGGSGLLYPNSVEHMFERFSKLVALTRGNLSDIGTTETELAELRIRLGKDVAKEWLEYMREPKNSYSLGLYWLNQTLKQFGFALSDIPTTEAELDQLHSKHALVIGLYWIQSFQRGGTGSFELFWDEVGTYFERGDFTLEDMGTTEEEFTRIKYQQTLDSAKLFLEWLRADNLSYKVADRIYRCSTLGGFSLADIGTSSDELESLRSRENKLLFG